MGYTVLNLGLTLTIPTDGTRNWGATLRNTTWTKISQHSHSGSGDGNPIGATGISDFVITRNKFAKNIGLFPFATTLVPVGTTQAIDFSVGSIQKLDLGSATGDVTLTLSNTVAGVVYKIITIQSATAIDIIWPTTIKWPQGQKLILTQTNDAIDMVELYYDGTDYFAQWNNDYRAS